MIRAGIVIIRGRREFIELGIIVPRDRRVPSQVPSLPVLRLRAGERERYEAAARGRMPVA